MKHSLRLAVIVLLALFVSLSGPTPLFALQHLEADKARQYIGEPKARFTGGGYFYEVLSRSHRDAMNGRFSDAVIFTKQTDKFYYKKRTDGHHIVVLDHPKGREENPVTGNPLVWKPIENTLNDDHPSPHVFLDEAGAELAIVYIGKKTRLKPKIDKNGLFELTIRVRTPSRQNVRLRK